MIHYTKGRWSLGFIFQVYGSTFPKATVWAFPSALIAALTYYMVYEWYDFPVLGDWSNPSSISMLWAGFQFILGFFLVFRLQQAYSRYWDGANLLRETRGELFNMVSSLFAFCNRAEGLKEEVESFQHLLVRLSSMLHCAMLQSVSDLDGESFPVLDTQGVSEDALKYLAGRGDNNQKCEIITQWIQRLIVDKTRGGIVKVPAPILTRSFQDLSRSIISIHKARNLTDIPFPFPCAQMLTLCLMFHWAITPFLAALILKSAFWSAVFTFITTFALWGTNYIAAEIENPFGDDPNDLPLGIMQEDFNQSLWLLLNKHTQEPPAFYFDKGKGRRYSSFIQRSFSSFQAEVESEPTEDEIVANRSKRRWSTSERRSYFSKVATMGSAAHLTTDMSDDSDYEDQESPKLRQGSALSLASSITESTAVPSSSLFSSQSFSENCAGVPTYADHQMRDDSRMSCMRADSKISCLSSHLTSQTFSAFSDWTDANDAPRGFGTKRSLSIGGDVGRRKSPTDEERGPRHGSIDDLKSDLSKLGELAQQCIMTTMSDLLTSADDDDRNYVPASNEAIRVGSSPPRTPSRQFSPDPRTVAPVTPREDSDTPDVQLTP